MFTPKLHDRLFNLVGGLAPHLGTGGVMTAPDVRALHAELLACAELAREQQRLIGSIAIAEAMGGEARIGRVQIVSRPACNSNGFVAEAP